MSKLDRFHIAALHVHSLSDTDRSWIFNHLNDNEKSVVKEHINKLELLAIPRDRKFIIAAIEALDEKSEKELYELLSQSVLVDIESVLDVFEREPSWVGACLKLEYPGLVESYITPKLSKIKSREIDIYLNEASDKFTNKFKSTVFDTISARLRELIPSLDEDFKKIEFDSILQHAV